MDYEVTQMMETMKFAGKRLQENQPKYQKIKKKFELLPSPCTLSPHSCNSIEFKGWTQTARDLEVKVNIKSTSCFVFSETDRIVIRTSDGQQWSCKLFDKINEEESSAVLRDGLLVLKMNKKQTRDWPFYTMADCSCQCTNEQDVDLVVDCASTKESTQLGSEDGIMNMSIDDECDITEGSTADMASFKGATISTLEVADRGVKLWVWIPGLCRGSLVVTFERTRASLVFQCSDTKVLKRQKLSDLASKFFLIVAFQEEVVVSECTWSVMTSPEDVVQLLVTKMESKVWHFDAVEIQDCRGLFSDEVSTSATTQTEPHALDPSFSVLTSSSNSSLPSPSHASSCRTGQTSFATDASTQTSTDASFCSTDWWRSPTRNSLGSIPPDAADFDLNFSIQTLSPFASVLEKSEVSSSTKKESQKPTCMVSPLAPLPLPPETENGEAKNKSDRLDSSSSARAPGYVGLDNLGNTCFISCVLQVLANTHELKNFFISGRYKSDLNAENPLGMGGRLALAFARLVEALWEGGASSFRPTQLKNLIGQKQSRFVGFLQHDAEELMEFLLDGLHEDLNRVKDKLYAAQPENDHANVDLEVAASEAWLCHRSRNDSFIVDLFQGQYRSVLTCPDCGKISITFDPFSVIQVPVPKKKMWLEVVLMPRLPSARPRQIRMQIERDAIIGRVFSRLSSFDSTLKSSNLRAMEVDGSRLKRILSSSSRLSPFSVSLLVCEVDDPASSGGPVLEIVVQQRTEFPLVGSTTKKCLSCRREDGRLRRCTKCFRASYCNQVCQRADWSRHKLECKMEGDDVGCPFVVTMLKSSATYKHLSFVVRSHAEYSVRVVELLKKSFQDVPGSTGGGGDGPLASSSPNSAMADHNYSAEESAGNCISRNEKQNDFPFHLIPHTAPCSSYLDLSSSIRTHKPLVDQGEKALDLDGVKVMVVLWRNALDPRSKKQVVVSSKQLDCDFHQYGVETHSENLSTQLEDCFALFAEPEILSPDQSWYCTQCKSECQATKELSLWRLPPNLIIHLKRFAFTSFFHREKIEDLVQFPVRGLDVSACLKRNTTKGEHATVYDLYGVINHHGGMLGGHYTSFARCYGDDVDGPIGWRLFDDTQVTGCGESDVVTSSAYVLFYRQRDGSHDSFPSTCQLEDVTHHRLSLSAPPPLASSSSSSSSILALHSRVHRSAQEPLVTSDFLTSKLQPTPPTSSSGSSLERTKNLPTNDVPSTLSPEDLHTPQSRPPHPNASRPSSPRATPKPNDIDGSDFRS